MWKDKISGVVFALIGIYVLLESSSMPKAELQAGPGPGVFPGILGILLIILGTALFFTSYIRKEEGVSESLPLHENPDEQENVDELFASVMEQDIDPKTMLFRVVLFTIFIAIYVFLLPILGFLISSILLGVAYTIYFYKINPVKGVLVTVVIASFGYLIFQVALRIPLPPPAFL